LKQSVSYKEVTLGMEITDLTNEEHNKRAVVIYLQLPTYITGKNHKY